MTETLGWPPAAEAWRQSAGLNWEQFAVVAGVCASTVRRWRKGTTHDVSGVEGNLKVPHLRNLEAYSPGLVAALFP